MKFAPYSEYKDSGLEWMGMVPKGWDVKRSDGLVSTERRQVEPKEFAGMEVFHYSIPVVQEQGTGAVENGDEIASAKQVITQPVLLVSKLNPRKATICIAEPKSLLTICSTEFVILQATRCDLNFLRYFALSEGFRQMLDSEVVSVTRSHQRADPRNIYRFWAAWPSDTEQQLIAAFLDRETAKIDTLLAKKRALIAVLKEKRAAEISRAVTRGLNPDVELKPSGVEWLGEVPEGWNRLPLTKYLTDKSDYRGKTPEKVTEGVLLVTARNVRMGFIDYETSQEFVREEEYDEIMRRGLPKRGDILFTTEAPLGNVALVDREDIALAQRIIRFRLNPAHLASQFGLYAMMSNYFQSQLAGLSTGSTAEGIKASKLFSLWFIAPSVSEQIAIAAYLDRETAKIDRMVGKVEAAMEKLKELRVALITAAVTGKIDVRTSVGDGI